MGPFMFSKGDKVRFDTCNKYNRGYRTSNSYEGILEEKLANGKWKVKVPNHSPAIIPEKHIKSIVNG